MSLQLSRRRVARVLACILLAACGGSDAPVDPTADAATAAPDAVLPPDGFVSACVDTGNAGTVTVGLAPYFGNPPVVLTHAADGSMLSRTTADSGTTIDVEVPSCGMVTLASFDEFATAPHLLTWVDVQPGDVLTNPRFPGYQSTTLSVAFTPLAGATDYQLVTTGDSTTTSTSPASLDARSRDGEFLVLAVADGTDGPSWAGTTATSGSVSLDTWSQSFNDVTVTVSDLPAEVAGLTAYTAYVQGDDFVLGPGAEATPAAGSASTEPLSLIDGIAQAQLMVMLRQASNVDHVTIARGVASDTATLTYDDFLAVPDSFDITGTPPRQTITWSSTADPADVDLVMLEAETGADWVVIAPPTATTVRYPEVPSDLLPPENPRADTIALASIDGGGDYRDALTRLDELNLVFYSSSVVPYRIAILGDLDPAIIEIP